MLHQYSLHTELIIFFIITLVLLAVYADTLNPFQPLSWVKRPFKTSRLHNTIHLSQVCTLTVRTSIFWKLFAYYKCGWHIVSNVRAGRKAKGKDLTSIISRIHHLRFDPKAPYLISGDHFTVLYPRNLGVFYHAMLDGHTALDATDWEYRQRTYLQTTAFALHTYSVLGDCSTTIVPVGRRAVCPIDIYRYPSDSLYGLLYALSTLMGHKVAHADAYVEPAAYTLETQHAGHELFATHANTLQILLGRYITRVYDPVLGLVRLDIQLASARDSVVRQSSFYDNVIFWKTCTLAQALGLNVPSTINLADLHERILEYFWQDDVGYFLDDLSYASKVGRHYSADWLAAYYTGFLNISVPHERDMLTRAVDYTIGQKLDQPFPLRYQAKNQAHTEIWLVRLVLPSYGGSAIWSFWGAEFIKVLLALGVRGEGDNYLDRARQHVATYEKMIVRYKGYPEVFSTEGKMLRSPLYQSVRQTGWVVGFEQAQYLLQEALASRAEK